VFTDRAISMEHGGRIDGSRPGTLVALSCANWLIVACATPLLDGRPHGAMHRRSVEQIAAHNLPPDA
jgi:hypothetical protein